jgi:glycosyltransferase involved in cell wall biosynthesis
MNDLLTGLSSEKMALYMQSGLPVIAFDYPSFKNIVDSCKCGVCIPDFTKFNEAINTILSNYSYYHNNAIECFKLYYDFEKNFQKVIDYIPKLKNT